MEPGYWCQPRRRDTIPLFRSRVASSECFGARSVCLAPTESIIKAYLQIQSSPRQLPLVICDAMTPDHQGTDFLFQGLYRRFPRLKSYLCSTNPNHSLRARSLPFRHAAPLFPFLRAQVVDIRLRSFFVTDVFIYKQAMSLKHHPTIFCTSVDLDPAPGGSALISLV